MGAIAHFLDRMRHDDTPVRLTKSVHQIHHYFINSASKFFILIVAIITWLGGVAVSCRTGDPKVAGSTSSQSTTR